MPEQAPKDKNETPEIARKRLIFRSWHRGTREIDLLLGRFADACVPGFDARQLALYDKLLQNNDPDLYNWVVGAEEAPEDEKSPVLDMLIDFYKCKS